ncbi:MAG: hypothetical protein ACE5G3_09300 [Gammaproteobacteria bacterium]
MHIPAIVATVLLSLITTGAFADDERANEITELRRMLEAVKNDYAARIDALEIRLARAERLARSADRSAAAGTSSPSAFNPAIGAVLVASWADIGQGWEDIPGFITGGEPGPGGAGFSLGESELNLNASIDSMFFGNLTLALEDEDGETEVGIEEAWVQTTGLPWGTTMLAGRYFSALGYLNRFHRHADDFTDRPLPYQAFLGGQYIADGLQARWIAPTPFYLEIGGELNWGSRFPVTGESGSAPDAWTLFANVGGDAGISHSWKAGLSFLSADVEGRVAGDEEPVGTPDAFTGDSDLLVLDLVWKWAPGGNRSRRNFKLQGEYFRRDEDGVFAGRRYDGEQDGWYLQGVWQFMPRWRTGYRHDRVNADNGPLFAGTVLQDPGRPSKRDSFMLDWSYSEFSRLRLQYTDDRVLDAGDKQFYLQYLMSIGAHGTHEC